MYDFFKNKAKNSSCMSGGVCSIHPSVNSLYQLILSEIREISFYLVKLNEFKLINNEVVSSCITALSTFLINTNYNKTRFLQLFEKLNNQKNEVKNKYLTYSKENDLPFEIISNSFEFEGDYNITDLIKYSQDNIINKQKNDDKEKFNLYELITIIARLCAIDVVKIKIYENNFTQYDFEIIRFFALTNSYSIRKEKLIRRIKEFSKIARKIRKKLEKIYLEQYGAKENTVVSFDIHKGHNILVSGSDLNELDLVLKAVQQNKNKETINVYTNGILFLAHQYPYFKNNKFLKGHFGTNNAEYDFSIFPGAILTTRNFIQKIDGLYKGEIFSNKLISFDKVSDIKNYDYKPLIETSLKIMNNSAKLGKNLDVYYKKDELEKIINNFEEKEIIIVLDSKINDELLETYEDKKILNFGYPYMDDILVETIEKLKSKEINITLFFTQCSLITLKALTQCLDFDLNIKIKPCTDALINPHVIEALKSDFNVDLV